MVQLIYVSCNPVDDVLVFFCFSFIFFAWPKCTDRIQFFVKKDTVFMFVYWWWDQGRAWKVKEFSFTPVVAWETARINDFVSV